MIDQSIQNTCNLSSGLQGGVAALLSNLFKGGMIVVELFVVRGNSAACSRYYSPLHHLPPTHHREL
jgi:hypothetical protein